MHDESGAQPGQAELTELSDRLADMPHVATVSPARFSEDADTALLDVQYDVPVTDPDLMGNLDPARGRRRAHPRHRPPGRARRGGPRQRRRPDGGVRRADRHRRRAVHPGPRVRLRRRRRTADRGRPHRPRREQRRDPAPRRHHGRQHRRPDGGHHGRPRCRHRLRPADRHPVRRVRPRRERGHRRRRPRRGHRRSLRGLRRGHRAGVADGPAPVGPPGLRIVRLRHRARRRGRDGRGPDPGAGAVPPGRSQGAAAQGPQGSRARRPRGRRRHCPPEPDRSLGRQGRPQAPPLGRRRGAGDDPAGAAGARHAHLAAGPVHPVVRPDHAQGLRPGHRRVRGRLHRSVRVRRRPRPGERLRHPGAGDGARRPRRHRRR